MEDELISELIQALDFVSLKNKENQNLNEEYYENSAKIAELEIQSTLKFLDKELVEVEDFTKSLFHKTGYIWHNVNVFTHSEAGTVNKKEEIFYCNRVAISYNQKDCKIIQQTDFIKEVRSKILKSIKEEIAALTDRNAAIASLLKKAA